MASLSRRRRAVDFWPGFVDALASLLMVMVFVILIFVIGQFVLADAVSGRDRALAQLNHELAVLAQSLSLEKQARLSADTELGELRASLRASETQRAQLGTDLQSAQTALGEREQEAARLSADLAALQRLKAEMEAEVARLASALDSAEQDLKGEQALSAQAIAQAELLNRQLAAVREQLEQLNAALAVATEDARAKDLRIEELGRDLNLALASRVQELARYRSEFFGRLRAVLGTRDDIQVVGDRFVFSSEVLFPTASDEISADGQARLHQLAQTLKTLAGEIPDDLPWVLQVDGHTDRRPISTARFPSNWELSTARALAIVKFLRAQGVAPQRLSATGYGEFHPLDDGTSEQAYARNRRIELKLTSR